MLKPSTRGEVTLPLRRMRRRTPPQEKRKAGTAIPTYPLTQQHGTAASETPLHHEKGFCMPSSSSRTGSVNNIGDTPPPVPHRPIEAMIATYRPFVCTPQEWGRVADFVRECARDAFPTDPHRARELMRQLARLTIWCLEEGFELDRDVMLTPDNIDRYCDVALTGLMTSSRATVRAGLRRAARKITTTAPWVPPATSLNASPRGRPYTAAEIQAFRSLPQPTPITRHRLKAILALGAGAGLSGPEYYSSAGTDVWIDDAGATCIQVRGKNARIVTVFDDWAQDLHDVAATVGSGHLMGGRMPQNESSRLWHLTKNVHYPTWTGRLVPERLRSSWLLRHLNQGTPLTVLLPAAGVTTTSFATQLLPYLDTAAKHDATAWLAGRR